ncbi:MAG: LD-carboxypeptidase [Acidobacteriota bacterium]
MELARPRRLRAGGRIGIAAVSGPVDPERLAAGVREIEGLGYRTVLAANVSRRHGFLAGTDAERAEGYRGLLTDGSIDAIFFARGGYGASRVLGLLDPAEVRAHPKIHLGGSDLTALLAFVGKHGSLVTFYGPMVAVEMGRRGALDWEPVLTGATPAEHRISPENVIAGGVAEGVLVGGCLSLLASLAGTGEAVSGADRILFWEDVAEPVYRLDRLLTQLERSGTLEDLRGMVIGSVLPGREESSEAVREYLRDRFHASPFPVVAGLPAGHLEAPRTLPLGVSVRLAVDSAGGTFRFSDSGLA